MGSVAELSSLRQDWILFEKTFVSDRTSRRRPRPLLTTATAEERRKGLLGTKHRDEWARFRKMLVEEPQPQQVTRLTGGGAPAWGTWGKYLRMVGAEDPEDPWTILNDGRPCLNLLECFPDWCAVGSRPLERGCGCKTRMLFELFFPEGGRLGDADMRMMEVGICAVQCSEVDPKALQRADLTGTTRQEWISYMSHGALVSSMPIESFNSGPKQEELRMAQDGLGLTGLKAWPEYNASRAMVAMEVDLERGEVGLALRGPREPRRGAASDEKKHYFRIPGLKTLDLPWVPYCALTGVKQRARLLEFHVVSPATAKGI